MSHAFISYSRTDLRFVRRLHAALEERGRSTWVDWERIPPAAAWQVEIARAIDESEAFVFVLSPDAVTSEVCLAELEVAVAAGKRVVPVLRREVPARDVPPEVAGLNWLFLRDTDDFTAGVDALVDTLDRDAEWLRFHTRLLTRAAEWHEHRGDDSYLLTGTDLDGVQRLLAESTDRQPPLTPLQTAYVAESQSGANARLRREARGFYLTSLGYGALQVVVLYVFAFDRVNEGALKFFVPTWVFPLAFGASGLLITRPTRVKTAVCALVVAALTAYLMYVVLPLA